MSAIFDSDFLEPELLIANFAFQAVIMQTTTTQARANISPRYRFLPRLVAGILLLNLLMFLLLIVSLYDSRKQYEKLAGATVANLSSLLEQDIQNSFFRIDLAIQAVADEANRQLHSGAIDADDINAFIARQAARLPQMSYLRMTDDQGNLLYGTGIRHDKKINVSDRDFFIRHREQPESGLIVSKPLISRTSGKWQLVLTRRITLADGEFGGMVPALIELDKISEKFSNLNIGRKGIINVYDNDMAMVLRFPAPAKGPPPIGRKIISRQFEDQLNRDPQAGFFHATSPVDQLLRSFSYRRLGDFPFYILVGLAADDYLSEWRKDVAKNSVLMILFALVTIIFSWFMAQAWKRSRRAEEQIATLAFQDVLTGLPNRRLMLDRLGHSLATNARTRNHGALLFIDLDNFKILNDTLGHDKGDLLLKLVAQRLIDCVREEDTVARLGGDEFVILQESLSEKAEEAATQAEAMGEKILDILNQPYLFEGHEHHSSPSIGITLYHGHQASIEELLKQADLAMYQAKTAGRNTLRFFDQNMQILVNDRVALVADLREAIQQQQFLLHFQPQVNMNGNMIGAEALLRWSHPQKGMVPPDEFIHLAEESGLIITIGNWVLESACELLVRWADDARTENLSISVNVSARQLYQDDFVDQVLSTIKTTGANPQRLKLELTESLLVSDIDKTIVKMEGLKDAGVGFSLDDFGTGYSSLAYLKQLPLDLLKIDQSFVRDLLVDPNDAAIATMIIALSETLGLPVIAEGVETKEQLDCLIEMGCKAYQGYLFSHPLAQDKLDKFVQKNSLI